MPLTDRDPHQPAGVVVNHRGEELVAALVGDLIDPEPGQAGEPVMQRLDIGPDPGDDRAHGAPGDPRWRYRRPRCLMDMSREPGPRVQRQLARQAHRFRLSERLGKCAFVGTVRRLCVHWSPQRPAVRSLLSLLGRADCPRG